MPEKWPYTIHDCKPVIISHTIANQSDLMTWDNLFIDDNQPKQTYNHDLKRPWEDQEETPKKKISKDISDAFAYDKPIKKLTPMDKHCRKRKCLHTDICSNILKIISWAKNQNDTKLAEDLLEKAKNKGK